jgi:8-oxo-dGTP pyrophosphatase MutT (NUDIX family)
MHEPIPQGWVSDPARLIPGIIQALNRHAMGQALFGSEPADLAATSAVLLLLSPGSAAPGRPPTDICLILNKRSTRVRQPGDLCYPGGGVALRFDFKLARLLGLPLGPLGRWPWWKRWRRERPLEARWLGLYFATALREAFEEMRLNPFRARFLGPLPHHRLVLFRRLIYPLAAWSPSPPRFRPNWEVERIVNIPLRHLLAPEHYICYRLAMPISARKAPDVQVRRVPAFRLPPPGGPEVLWGATYRITMAFLQIVFGFSPPVMESLPVVDGHLENNYLTGER